MSDIKLTSRVFRLVAAVGAASLVAGAQAQLADSAYPGKDWAIYGGAEGTHFSTLSEINTANVGRLAQAWRYDTGPGALQTSPLVIDGILYGMTPTQEVIALDGATGQLRWRTKLPTSDLQPVRGLTMWRDGGETRLFVGAGPWLNALDPATGKLVPGFGDAGRVDLRAGFDPGSAGPVAMTSPGVLWHDLIIVGFRTTEGKPAAAGVIRAYDVHTGALRWSFHAIPRPNEPGSETWAEGSLGTAGGANNWTGMTVDTRRGIVFVPTGSAADDFYGADRIGPNLYANSLVALDAGTGKRLWHYQIVHHDILDRDLPSPPVLLTVRRGGKLVDAVAQATKHGDLFVFDRVTGQPLFPTEERPVPASLTPGEQSWPTQPKPAAPAPFARQSLTADLLTTRTPEAHAAVVETFARARSEGPFTPVDVDRKTIIFPGFDGGAEWGGQAVDPARGVFFINANDVPWIGSLAKVTAGDPNSGAVLYERSCAGCHGLDRQGSPPEFPSLQGIVGRKMEREIITAITGGKGRMPAFDFDQQQQLAIVNYLRGPSGGDNREMQQAGPRQANGQDYIFTGYQRFVDPDGYPAVAPPWGTLSAIDLNSGKYVWRVPLGYYPELAATGLANTGTENYGGPILTASGVLFIGATVFDRVFRAFDAARGALLWSAPLPYSGVTTPVTYRAGGRQFVVIGTSAYRDPKAAPGSGYVAFALPAAPR